MPGKACFAERDRHFYFLFCRHFCFLGSTCRSFILYTLINLLNKPRSQTSGANPPRCRPSFLSRTGFQHSRCLSIFIFLVQLRSGLPASSTTALRLTPALRFSTSHQMSRIFHMQATYSKYIHSKQRCCLVYVASEGTSKQRHEATRNYEPSRRQAVFAYYQ